MTETSGATITANFSTRRQAELAVEQLVQEIGIERTDIFVTPAGDENSAGTEAEGADLESGHPGVDPAGDPALEGGLTVSIDLIDEAGLSDVRSVLEQHGGEDIAAE